MSTRRLGRPRHPEPLTPAEQRLLPYIREGMTNAEIAGRIGLSPETVKYHIANMLSKLGLADRLELAGWKPQEVVPVRRAWLAAIVGPVGKVVRSPTGTLGSWIVLTAAVTAVAAGIVVLLVRTGGGGHDEQDVALFAA
jgi:DNA-binding CsgD family transcriptional regulator